MKKILKILAILLLIVVIAIVAGFSYLKFGLPNVGEAPDITIERTPERIARGEYLVKNVMACLHCHSTMDHSKFGKPPIHGTEGAGGEEFSMELGFPGNFYAKNITPAALGEWSDGEIFRAITSGVSKDGTALFTLMPYQMYGRLDREDVYSIIAFIRTLKPVEKTIPKSEPVFPVSLLINTAPKKPEFSEIPDKSDMVEYGKYMVTAAACYDCHTPMDDKGNYFDDLKFSGGFTFKMQTGGTTRSANITPDKETGIGNWTEEYFVSRFKQYADSSYVPKTIGKNEFNTEMPWLIYSKMDTTDLVAMYHYLKTLTPINNRVEKFTLDE